MPKSCRRARRSTVNAGAQLASATAPACSDITVEETEDQPASDGRPKIKLEIDLEELMRRQQEEQELTPEQIEQQQLDPDYSP